MSHADSEYAAEIRREREQKDEFFGGHPRSPVPADQRDDFEGLRYFEIDPEYRFEVTLEEHDDPERITVETTAEGEQVYDDVGEFHFEVGGEAADGEAADGEAADGEAADGEAADGGTVTLHAFQSPDDEDRLWVPFRDATSGEETYPAGRYLDLEDPDHRTEDGDWILDFNEAYNPFCAYSEAYECPLVPMDNWLDVPIRAGEKAPDIEGGH